MNKKTKKIILLASIIFTIISIFLTVLLIIKFNIMTDFLYRFKNYFGDMPLCNMRKDRAFKIGTFVFPLCARCTGVVIGVLINTIVWLNYTKKYKYILIISILLLFPMIIDGVIQYGFNIESTNLRRFITGIIFGIGVVNIIFIIMNKILIGDNSK